MDATPHPLQQIETDLSALHHWATTIEPRLRQFDRLLCLFEDLAAGRSVNIVVTRDGPTVFDPGAPTGPVRVSAPSSVHMVVPR